MKATVTIMGLINNKNQIPVTNRQSGTRSSLEIYNKGYSSDGKQFYRELRDAIRNEYETTGRSGLIDHYSQTLSLTSRIDGIVLAVLLDISDWCSGEPVADIDGPEAPNFVPYLFNSNNFDRSPFRWDDFQEKGSIMCKAPGDIMSRLINIRNQGAKLCRNSPDGQKADQPDRMNSGTAQENPPVTYKTQKEAERAKREAENAKQDADRARQAADAERKKWESRYAECNAKIDEYNKKIGEVDYKIIAARNAAEITDKARREAAEITENARKEAAQIKEDARKSSEEIISKAKTEAGEISETAEAFKKSAEKEKEKYTQLREDAERNGDALIKQYLADHQKEFKHEIDGMMAKTSKELMEKYPGADENTQKLIDETNALQKELAGRMDASVSAQTEQFSKMKNDLEQMKAQWENALRSSVEQINASKSEMFKQMRTWQHSLYQNENEPLAQAFVDFYRVVNADRLLREEIMAKGKDGSADDRMKSLNRLNSSLNTVLRKFENALNRLDLYAYYPKEGDFFDPESHMAHLSEEEADNVDPDEDYSGRPITGYYLPGVKKKIRDDMGDEVIIKAEVTVDMNP